MQKQVILTKLEGGFLLQRENRNSVHPNFGHVLKEIRTFLGEERGTAANGAGEVQEVVQAEEVPAPVQPVSAAPAPAAKPITRTRR